MHFSPDLYLYLLSLHAIPNSAQQDDKGTVLLPPTLVPSFENGFTVADIIRKVSINSGKEPPPSLANVKSDLSRSTKQTNWNFIWIALDSLQIRMDGRIKELILQGEQALIVELVRQIYERDGNKPDNNKSSIRIKQGAKLGSKQTVDMKKLDMSKNPDQSQTALQFLMLLLKTSLQMSVQEILGLFTNQNKYLAQIIVKGVGGNFDPIVLFYTLLTKHGKKLRYFYNQDAKDAQACLNAIKPGLISKSEKVVGLTIDLFGGLGNIYGWFVTGEASCATTFFLGVKRHPQLKSRFWKLLLQIIKQEEITFFSKCYNKSFQSAVEQIEITTILVQLVADWERSDELVQSGVVLGWIGVAGSLREDDIQAQIIAFRFIGELMAKMGEVVQSNEEAMKVLQREWYMRTLPEFTTLFNQLILILQQLGNSHSLLASRIYLFITSIAKSVGAGDKRDYLVQNFTPLVSKFPTIPTEYLTQHFKGVPLSHAQFLLVCQAIEINKSVQTMLSVGGHIKGLFFENPLLNFYLSPLLKEIIQKVINHQEQEHGAHSFIMRAVEEAISIYASLQIKYKSKMKHEAISFGKRETNDKGNKQEQAQLRIKQKWKEILLGFIMSVLNVVISKQDEPLKQSFRLRLLNSNNLIKAGNFKVGSRAIQDALSKRFNMTKQQLHQSFEQYSKKTAQMSDSMVRSVKPVSHVTVASRIKGPENLTREFQQMADRRRQEEEERRVQELKKKATEQKKRLSVKKQLQISNLLRGQIGEAQLREQGFLQRLIQEPKELQVIPSSQIQQRDLQSIDATFKKYHKVLRHLFLTYTFTSYNGHASQKFQDNQQRKEILTIVELVRLLKDYKLFFLTNQTEIGGMVRDINLKLLGRREVGQLDYSGFQMFITQFCALIMTRNHTITTTSSQGKSVSQNQFKNEPLHAIVAEFFSYLKGVFVTRGEKTGLFDDAGDSGLSKEQAAQIEDYNKKFQEKPDFILPKGFKKVSENTIKFNNTISNNISPISEAYSAVLQIIDQLLSQQPFSFHIIESISQKTTVIKVKPTTLGLQKERALSTFIEKPLQDKIAAKRRSTSKGVIIGPPKSQRSFKEQSTPAIKGVAEAVQGGTTIQGSPKIDPNVVAKEQAKQKRLQSMMKLQELQKSKQQAIARKAQKKQEQRQAEQAKEKQAQAKRREQTERFLQAQRLKIAQKRRKQEEEQQRKAEEQEQKQAAKRENKEKFKVFHQQQVGKIKKIQQTALEKIRKERMQLQQSKEQREEQRRRLKSQIEEQDKRIIQIRKQTEKKIQSLFESDPIRKVFSKFQPNLRGIFDFLLANTYISLTEKRHNNEIVFQTWRQFVSSFELTAFVLPKDTTLIFKSLTKGKLANKDYYVGLTYPEFQQALLRLCIKYRNIFNLVAEKIKDDITQSGVKGVKEKEKEQNEFQAINEGTIKDILRENASKDSIQEWGEVSQVTDRTLTGMIYYLKVPRSKQGQEKRFRQIIARPHPVFAHQAEWLKEKLNEEYTLQEVVKKGNGSRVMRGENMEASGVDIK